MNKVDSYVVPHDVYVILTEKCNLRCLHCYGSFGEPEMGLNELTGEEWCRVFTELSEAGVFYVNIAGGEPTIHPDFPEIIDHLKNLGMHYILTTNGMGSRRANRAIIESAEYLIGLKVSLDGPTPESHGTIRVGRQWQSKAQYFDKTVQTVRDFVAADVPVTIASCLHQKNIDLMPEFRELIAALNPISWFISTIAPTGRARKFYDDIYVSDDHYPYEYWAQLAEEFRRRRIYVRFVDMPTATGYEGTISAFSCPAASSFCEINADGLVSPCPLSRVNIKPEVLRFPNVREGSILDAWRSPSFNTFRGWRESGCSGCSAFSNCGRCVAQSVEWFDGDPHQPTPFCIEKGEILGLDDLPRLRSQVARKMDQVRSESVAVNLLSTKGDVLA